MRKNKVIVGIGEILWDFLPNGKQLGGAPANFAFHAGQAGYESYVVSAVGNDQEGNEIQERIASLGLHKECIQTNSYSTGKVTISLNEHGNPNYTIHENVAWDYIRWDDELSNLAKKTDAVCFGSLAQRNPVSQQTILSFLKTAPQSSMKVFDINLRQNYYTPEIFEESLQYANILKLNEEELPVLASFCKLKGSVEQQLDSILKSFRLKCIAYTMGEKGSMILNHEGNSYLKPPKIEVCDTIGAGDSFTAVLVAGLLEHKSLKIIHQKATEIAAQVCLSKGATPSIDKELYRF